MIFDIPQLNMSVRRAAHDRWATLAHPLGSLGLLETAIEDIAALTGDSVIDLKPRFAVVMCADNGVVCRGVTQTDSGVTAIVARNLAAGRTAVCRMANLAACQVLPVDMGIKDFNRCDGVLDRRVGNGTGDITVGSAMTRRQAERAIQTGIDTVFALKNQGARLIAAGEMGIGNTTTAAAVTSVLLGIDPEAVTGRGAGLSGEGLKRKISAVKQAIFVNNPNKNDIIELLSKVGGYDIAGMCGLYIGGAIHRVPIIIDGAISAAAALCAMRLDGRAGQAMIASHVSAEPMGRLLLDSLGKRPVITADMRLGEGTGAVALMPLLDMAAAVYSESYTFDEGKIPAYQPMDN